MVGYWVGLMGSEVGAIFGSVTRDGNLVHLNWISIHPIQLDWIISIQNFLDMDMDIFKKYPNKNWMGMDIQYPINILFEIKKLKS